MAAPDAPAACLLHFGDERAAAARLAAFQQLYDALERELSGNDLLG